MKRKKNYFLACLAISFRGRHFAQLFLWISSAVLLILSIHAANRPTTRLLDGHEYLQVKSNLWLFIGRGPLRIREIREDKNQ